MPLIIFVLIKHWRRCRRGGGEAGGGCRTPGQTPALCYNVEIQEMDLTKPFMTTVYTFSLLEVIIL